MLDDLMMAIRKFLWSGSTNRLKLIQVAWLDYCYSLAKKGLGLKDLSVMNEAM